MPAERSSGARARILETAARLFHEHGVRSVGIDRIVAESDVATMTLYRHFASKDELIEAVVKDQDGRWRARTLELIAGHADPSRQLIAIFDALERELRSPRYCGCLFQSTSIGLASASHPAARAVRANKRWLRALLRRLAEQAGAPATLGDQLMLLHEGAMISREIEGDRSAGAAARDTARQLLRAARKR